MSIIDNNFFWEQKKSNLLSQNKDIHFYFVNLNQSKKIFEKMYSVLSIEEQNYTNEYLQEKPKSNFIISQGMLRFLLSLYLDISPKKLVIERDNNGKPFVTLKESKKIFFNKSHSGDYALFGFTYLNSIGVDIEKRRTIENLNLVAEKVLTEKELAFLYKVPKNKQSEYFLKYWICKESFVKAIGDGLRKDFKSIELYISPKNDNVRVFSINNEKPKNRETICLIHQVKDYLAAFSLQGSIGSTSCITLNIEEFILDK